MLATTLGETGGDALSMTLKLGYAVSSAIFIAFFAVAVVAQIRARAFHPFLYWAVIVATTTAGTTMADFADRSLGVGYLGGSAILFVLVIGVLALWRARLGAIAVDHITDPGVETFYWVTILFSNTLGATLGDLLTKPRTLGGFHLDRIGSSALLAALIVACILVLPQRAARPVGQRS